MGAGAADPFPEGAQPVVGDLSGPDEVPQHLEHGVRLGAGELGDTGEEEAAGAGQQVQHRPVQIGVDRSLLLDRFE
jgi:hypothetical protein